MSDAKAKALRLARGLARHELASLLEQCYEALTIGNNYLLGSLEEYRDAGEDDCSLAIGIRKALHEVDAALALFELPGEEKDGTDHARPGTRAARGGKP